MHITCLLFWFNARPAAATELAPLIQASYPSLGASHISLIHFHRLGSRCGARFSRLRAGRIFADDCTGEYLNASTVGNSGRPLLGQPLTCQTRVTY